MDVAIVRRCPAQEAQGQRPEYLVKVLLLLVQSCAGSIRSLHINHQVFHLVLQPLLCLFQGSTFGVDGFNVFLCILQALCQLLPGRR